jgi:hypothetical protein
MRQHHFNEVMRVEPGHIAFAINLIVALTILGLGGAFVEAMVRRRYKKQRPPTGPAHQ